MTRTDKDRSEEADGAAGEGEAKRCLLEDLRSQELADTHFLRVASARSGAAEMREERLDRRVNLRKVRP